MARGAAARSPRQFPVGGLPEEAGDILKRIARGRFAAALADPAFRALQWPRVERGLEFYLDFERGRRGGLARLLVEEAGALEIPLRGGAAFKLTARADRIEILEDGSAVVVDYKSGAPPGVSEVQVGFAPQLTLEAAMLARGAFAAAKGVEGGGRALSEARRRQRRRNPRAEVQGRELRRRSSKRITPN